jgi:mannose-6-phosphate isomerase-like protein (cupin superfamily)
MRTRQACRMFLSATIAFATVQPSVSATKPEGYKSISLARGHLDETGTSSVSSDRLTEEGNDQHGLSARKKEQLSDIYVQSNVWAPGGSTGWHSHPGHSVIIVIAGTVTNYEGHDPTCKPHVYKAGMTFIDPGGAHIHILRNEGAVEAKTIAVQFIPSNAERRIDVADPGYCHF